MGSTVYQPNKYVCSIFQIQELFDLMQIVTLLWPCISLCHQCYLGVYQNHTADCPWSRKLGLLMTFLCHSNNGTIFASRAYRYP
ncbi:hypothetical protein FKM82_022654 [Ascaphus truei]